MHRTVVQGSHRAQDSENTGNTEGTVMPEGHTQPLGLAMVGVLSLRSNQLNLLWHIAAAPAIALLYVWDKTAFSPISGLGFRLDDAFMSC